MGLSSNIEVFFFVFVFCQVEKEIRLPRIRQTCLRVPASRIYIAQKHVLYRRVIKYTSRYLTLGRFLEELLSSLLVRTSPELLHTCEYLKQSESANVAHTRQSRPDSGLGVQVRVVETFGWFRVRSEAVLGNAPIGASER